MGIQVQAKKDCQNQRIAFSTKAQTLENLRNFKMEGNILPSFIFTVQEWLSIPQDILAEIEKVDWSNENLVVRSSALSEDTLLQSNAGKYESVLNVNKHCLNVAIDRVIKSYGEQTSPLDEVLIQPHVEDVCISGVVFTSDPNSGGLYYIINYEMGENTSSVTSGTSDQVKTKIIHKAYMGLQETWIAKLCKLCENLEDAFQHKQLDIEFAIDKAGNIFLLQVRPLILQSTSELTIDQQKRVLQHIESKVNKHSKPHPYLHGKRTVFGVMPDWNPAEIVGIKPKPLALSLYKDLVTDSIWAYQRDNYGYKNLRSFPLLIDFFGLPYVDVRVSFNSFLPKEIDDDLADRLIDYYIEKLINNPFLHDKVEFEIVLSCYTFDLEMNLSKLRAFGFNEKDCLQIKDSLRNLTNKIINPDNGLWKNDLEKIETLKSRHEILMQSDLDLITRTYWLLEDCKRYGTLPFAGLARAGFIAMQVLNSMVTEGALSVNQKYSFLNNLDTISSTIKKDLNILDKTTFLSKYGHLRPGTYDITSPRYDEQSELYFDWEKIHHAENDDIPEFQLSFSQLKAIDKLLKDHKIEHDVIGLFSFLKTAIEGREYAKFVFTKSLSDALSFIKKLGSDFGFSADDMSYADINIIRHFYNSSKHIKSEIEDSIKKGKELYQTTKGLILPPLIVDQSDIWHFEFPEAKPNFITHKSITAYVGELSQTNDIKDKLVFIPNADPGYDWIFTHNIAGFVTAYGGVNSHMAIRAGELGLPAVVGAGEVLFQKWGKAKLLALDCLNQKIEIIH